METKRSRSDFINFIMDAQKNPDLTNEFLSKKTAKDLHSFFHEKNYKDIPYNDCQEILMAQKRMRGHRIPHHGKKVSSSDCVSEAKNY
jgi:hypothetical protein